MTPGVIVIEPDGPRAAALTKGLRAARCRALVVPDLASVSTAGAIDALFVAAAHAPAVVTALREEGLRPALFVTVESEAQARAGLAALDPEAAIVVGSSALDAATVETLTTEDHAETTRVKSARLRELFELSLLGGSFERSAKRMCERVAHAFHVDDVLLLGAEAHDRVLAHAGGSPVEQLLPLVDLAVAAHAPLVCVKQGRSVLAAPLDAAGAGFLGAVCLVAAGVRRFTTEERGVLAALARRAGGELAMRTAHARLSADHERLRQSGQMAAVVPVAPPQRTSDIMVIPEAEPLAPGTVLGGMYAIVHEISRGGMGIVYRGEDLGLRRPVAIKVLRPELADDAKLVARFRNEAATLAAIRHENLVHVHAFAADGDLVFFVMELVEGESLADRLARADAEGEMIPAARVAQMIAQVASALDTMHGAGVIHRDVKPANIVIDRARERVVLVDVGSAEHAADGELHVTPGFAAPEALLAGRRENGEGPGTDIYSLAATAFMLLTHVAPFGGGAAARVLRRQLGETPARASRLRPGLSPEVDTVLDRALRPTLAERPAKAGDLARELTGALGRRRPPSAPSLVPFNLPAEDEPLSRGAYFRVAYRILANRLGSAWIGAALSERPQLAQVLGPGVDGDGFFPLRLLLDLIGQTATAARDPLKVAHELGRAAMTASFARLLGSDPKLTRAADLLRRLPAYWPRLHRWGRLGVVAGPRRSLIAIADTPRDPLACRLVLGSVERIAELAGAAEVEAQHTGCETQGAPACTMEVRWRET